MNWIILLIQLIPSIITAIQAIIGLFRQLPQQRREVYAGRMRRIVKEYKGDKQALVAQVQKVAAELEEEVAKRKGE